MARGGVDPLVRYLVLGGLGWAGWNWASAQPAGSWARGMIDQARHATASLKPAPSAKPAAPAAKGAPPSSGGQITQAYQVYQRHDDGKCWLDTGWSDGHVDSQLAPDGACGDQGMQATSLVDVEGFPIVMDPNRDALRQDPAQGGTNVYQPGDVLVDANTQAQYLIVAGRGGVILQGPDGAYVASDDFFV